ncbi:MAG: hypothetical protein QNJ58_19790 [Desulfobacterales bacterium]|nr:hypothetical protein [Desulfobacterales bacterium]
MKGGLGVGGWELGLQVAGQYMLDAGCWMLDAGYWIRDARYWIRDAGYGILDAGCSMLDAGCWIEEKGKRAKVQGAGGYKAWRPEGLKATI